MKFLSVFLVTLVTTASALHFTADIVVDGDPNVYGYVTGRMWYLYNEVNRSLSIMRIDYNAPVNMKEFFVFQKGVHYRNCGQCEAETYKLFPEQFYKLATDRSTGATFVNQGVVCDEYRRDNSNVKFIYFDPAGKICRVKLSGTSGTRTYTFSNVDTTTSVTTAMDLYKSWSCPGPVCNRVADMVLVLDESGSIYWSSWQQELDFAEDLVSEFTVSTAAVNVGTVFFDDGSRVVSWLQSSYNSWQNALRTAGKSGGNTCIGCGMNSGMQVLNSPRMGRAGVSRMMFTLTDGENNRPWPNYDSHLATAAANVKNAGVLSFAIGVGSARDSDLNVIKSDIPGTQTKFHVSGFGALNTILKQLVTVSCQDMNLLPCGQACHGFCSCGGACVCPACAVIDKCTNNVCSPASPLRGCAQTPVSCNNPNDLCYTYGCDPATGCTKARVDCNDQKVCTTDSCVPKTGCQNIPLDCDDHNACTRDACVNAGGVGCTHTNISCNDNNACTKDFCDPKTSCYYPPVVCDDGDPCTDDSCDKATGCKATRKTCDDGDPCTIDSCDPVLGCVHRQKDCDDHDICTQDGCNSATGQCTHPTVRCDACQQWASTGGSCAKKPCHDVECVQVGESGHDCNYTSWTDTKCNSGNKCIIDKCDPSTEQCSSEPKKCDYVNCTDTHCDPLTGNCVNVNRNCSTSDPCWIYECDKPTDTCRRKPKCAAQPCKTATCNNGQCTWTDMNCDAGTVCLIAMCENDKCEYLARDCDDNEVCTKDTCHTVNGCEHEIIPCNDDNPCTIDFCENGTGCVYKPKCDDGQFCTIDDCNMDTGECSYSEYPCVFEFSADEKECFEGACSNESLYGGKHCYKKVRDDAFLNPCGECIQTYSSNKSIWNRTDAGKDCVGKWELPKFIATLSGGVIAAIVVGVLVGVAIVAVLGTLATKELIRRARLAQDQSAHNNPLYKDNDREMQNPAFGGK